MDRPIPIQTKRNRRLRLGIIVLLCVGALAAAVWQLRNTLQTSINSDRIRIAVVEEGPIENTLNATGLVLPEFEQVSTAPISAAIEQVFRSAGSQVKAGDLILKLDKKNSQLQFEKLQEEWELRRNGIGRLRLQLEKNLRDLRLSDSIKALRINSLSADLDDAKRLDQVGGGTKETVEKAKLDLEIARLEKKQLENDLQYRQQSMQSDLRESEIQASIQSKNLQELENKLNQADVVAKRAGVVTWVNENIGAAVNEGEALARIADLSSFTIKGTIADMYADRIHTGMRVYAQINDERIDGAIVNIHPTIENNTLTFDVALDNKKHPALRPNQKVDLYIITESKAKALRVHNGPAFVGGRSVDLFVMRGENLAERRKVTTGLSSFEYIELLDNVSAGERVIVSDLNSYRHVNTLEIKQRR